MYGNTPFKGIVTLVTEVASDLLMKSAAQQNATNVGPTRCSLGIKIKLA